MWVRGTALCCCRNAVGSRQQGRPLLLVGTRFCCLSALPALAASLARSLDSVLKLYCRGPFVLAATRLASLCVSTRPRVRVRVRARSPACSLARASTRTHIVLHICPEEERRSRRSSCRRGRAFRRASHHAIYTHRLSRVISNGRACAVRRFSSGGARCSIENHFETVRRASLCPPHRNSTPLNEIPNRDIE